jgi:uncharacterized protein (UPF0276 family)
MSDISMIDFTTTNRVLDKSSSPHYGLHLGIRKADMGMQMTNDDVYDRMCRNIQVFKKNLSVPLLLENSPDTPHDRRAFDLYPYNEHEQINRIIVDNNVYMLLDITHAKITAQFRKMDIFQYLGGFPLNRVKEIHTNGSGYDIDGFPKDTHQDMKEEDFELLDWVLNRTNPDIITLEYNGAEADDYDTILSLTKHQIKQIQKLAGNM